MDTQTHTRASHVRAQSCGAPKCDRHTNALQSTFLRCACTYLTKWERHNNALLSTFSELGSLGGHCLTSLSTILLPLTASYAMQAP